MNKDQSLVRLYYDIIAGFIAQGKTTMTRAEIHYRRQEIWATWKANGYEDRVPMTHAASQHGLKELFNVGPKGKRINVRFVV